MEKAMPEGRWIRHYWQTDVMAVAAAAGMVAAAEALRQPEVIFPEIAALTVGGWVAASQPWIVGRKKQCALMAAVSVLGMLLARFSPLPMLSNVALAFGAIAGLLLALHVTFYPAFSAGILPILLGVRTGVYPLSVTALVLLVALGQWGLEKAGMRRPPMARRWHYDARRQWLRFGGILMAVILLGLIGRRLHAPMLIAPPLIVGAVEIADPESPAGARIAVCWAVVAICAVLGAGCRAVLMAVGGLPGWAAAGAALFLVLMVARRARLYFPPAGAVALLPFLLPGSALRLYPLEVAAGFALLGGAAMGIRRIVAKPRIK
jgi:hypothetical protein